MVEDGNHSVICGSVWRSTNALGWVAERDTMSDEPAAASADRAAAEIQAVYDRIASHFAQTREYAWPEVESFVTSEADRGELGRALDLGCGNGRHMDLLAEYGAAVVGCDVSRQLLLEAVKRRENRDYQAAVVGGDAAQLPFATNTFRHALYVATLHHLRPAETRRASLAELGRVLEPGGRGLVSAWSTAHDRFDAEDSFATTVEWTLPGGETVDRYYYIYAPGEFRAELDAVSEIECVSMELSSGNCYAVIQPTDVATP